MSFGVVMSQKYTWKFGKTCKNSSMTHEDSLKAREDYLVIFSTLVWDFQSPCNVQNICSIWFLVVQKIVLWLIKCFVILKSIFFDLDRFNCTRNLCLITRANLLICNYLLHQHTVKICSAIYPPGVGVALDVGKWSNLSLAKMYI